jgi:hypothetical protein
MQRQSLKGKPETGKDAAVHDRCGWLGLAWCTYLVFYKDVMEILASSFFSNLKVVIGFVVVLCVLIKILKD